MIRAQVIRISHSYHLWGVQLWHRLPVKIPPWAGRDEGDWFAIISHWPKAFVLWFEGIFDLLILQETGIDKPGDFKGCSFNHTPLPAAQTGNSDHREGQVLGFEGLAWGHQVPSLSITSFVTASAKFWEQQLCWPMSLSDALATGRE